MRMIIGRMFGLAQGLLMRRSIWRTDLVCLHLHLRGLFLFIEFFLSLIDFLRLNFWRAMGGSDQKTRYVCITHALNSPCLLMVSCSFKEL